MLNLILLSIDVQQQFADYERTYILMSTSSKHVLLVQDNQLPIHAGVPRPSPLPAQAINYYDFFLHRLNMPNPVCRFSKFSRGYTQNPVIRRSDQFSNKFDIVTNLDETVSLIL